MFCFYFRSPSRRSKIDSFLLISKNHPVGRIGVVARLILALCFSIGDDTYHNPTLASVFGDNQKPLGEHLCLLCVVLCPLTLWPPQSSWEILEGLTENSEHTGSKTTAPKSKEADVIYFLLVLHCILLHPTLRENCMRSKDNYLHTCDIEWFPSSSSFFSFSFTSLLILRGWFSSIRVVKGTVPNYTLNFSLGSKHLAGERMWMHYLEETKS